MLTEHSLNFLVVEDSPLSNQFICNMLRDLGHQVVGQAYNAQEALELTLRLKPDIVLMDLQMPDPLTGHDDERAGIKGTRAIQAHRPTPVIALTAYESAELIREASEAGVGAYLIKPPDIYAIERAALVAYARFKDQQTLQRLNEALQREIAIREQLEARLQEYTDQLERKVVEKLYELEQEQAKVIHLDKLAALGEMATGIVHELVQPLSAISYEADYIKLLIEQAETPGILSPQEWENLRKIGENLKEDLARCKRLIDHLRTFGRSANIPPIPVDLNQPIYASLMLVNVRLGHRNVDLQLHLAEHLPPILADPYKLEQVFLNLISNAEYALEQQRRVAPAGYQKTLTITTQTVGEMVEATVHDNGCGIPPEAQERLFQPFFTTKPQGEGTGLGLSISRRIVTEFGGTLTCESVVGEGTKFTLRFPAFRSEN